MDWERLFFQLLPLPDLDQLITTLHIKFLPHHHQLPWPKVVLCVLLKFLVESHDDFFISEYDPWNDESPAPIINSFSRHIDVQFFVTNNRGAELVLRNL